MESKVNAASAAISTEKAGYRVAVITLSDKGAAGGRADVSGGIVSEIAENAGYAVVEKILLPDDQALLEAELRRIADTAAADLILTTGGTGFSPRDITPEATLAVAERLVPGIAEAMRTAGMAHTKRAMLSRAASVIRKRTLIVNLPGSPKAVRENLTFIIDVLSHGIGVLTGREGECAR
jgi:molybdenum cofactor synthesis domain-containing protein